MPGAPDGLLLALLLAWGPLALLLLLPHLASFRTLLLQRHRRRCSLASLLLALLAPGRALLLLLLLLSRLTIRLLRVQCRSRGAASSAAAGPGQTGGAAFLSY